MNADLAGQIRALCDSAEPVTPAEAMLRARRRPPAPSASRRSRLRWPHALFTGIALAACTAVIWNANLGSPQVENVPSNHSRIVLTAVRLNEVVRNSSAAASSGAAQVTQTTMLNGRPQSTQATAVTFDGANIDEQITVQPQPVGSTPAFTTDERFVGGQFYIHTTGPEGLVEWLHDKNSASDAASMHVPDPRTLYNALAPAANFEVVGSEASGGTTLTHLRALDPGAIPSSLLGSLSDRSLASFNAWIDPNDVVKRVAFKSFSTSQGWRVSSSKLKAFAARHKHMSLKSLIALRAAAAAAGIHLRLTPQTMSSTVTVTYTNLGKREMITAPPTSVNFRSKG